MSDFKKLPCLAGCPTDSGLVDCDGKAINLGDAVARCSDIPEATVVSISGTKPTGNAIGTITIDGVPTVLKETLTTLVSVTFDEATRTLSVTYKGEDGVEVTREDNIPAISAVIHIAPAVITPPTKYPEYYNQIVTDANGNFWGFSIDGTPTLLNIVETITSIYDILAYANKHEIFKYQNESGLAKSVYETVTTVKSLSYNKATSVLTVVYTDENGDDITKTTEIGSQSTVYINGTNPATATIFSQDVPPTVNNNALKADPDYIYIGTDGSSWYWNGTTYVTAPVPADTTEWYSSGTTIDAKGNKIAPIYRLKGISVGAKLTSAISNSFSTSLYGGYDDFSVQKTAFLFRDSRFGLGATYAGFQLSNGGGGGDYFPIFTANPRGTTVSFLIGAGYTSAADDAAGNITAAVSFRANRDGLGASPLLNRPLFRWQNYTTTYMQMDVAGRVWMGLGGQNADAQLQINSTDRGFLPPRMTTAQVLAIAAPTNGLVVFNTTLGKLCVREAGAWRQVTTTAM